MEIASSARKHGVADEDMRHAIRLYLAAFLEPDSVTMYIGPARTGAILEVGVLDAYSEDPVIIHAMPARAAYLDQLRKSR